MDVLIYSSSKEGAGIELVYSGAANFPDVPDQAPSQRLCRLRHGYYAATSYLDRMSDAYWRLKKDGSVR